MIYLRYWTARNECRYLKFNSWDVLVKYIKDMQITNRNDYTISSYIQKYAGEYESKFILIE